MEKLYRWGCVVKIGLVKLVVGSIKGSDNGRAIFAESNTNFTEGFFQKIVSELPASSWRISSYKRKYREGIAALIVVQAAISSANNFSSLEILQVSFCSVVGGASCVLGVGWKSAFAELFVFPLGSPRAPTGVERRNFGSLGLGSGRAKEVGLRLGLNRGLVAEFLTAISLLERSR